MGEQAGIDFEFRRAVAAGELPGPRLFVSGTALSASHGHGAALGVADGVDEVRKAVRANLKAGADHIKLFVTGGVSSRGTDIYAYHYSREEIRAAVEEAHRAGRKVAAHAHGGDGVTLCAEEGVDSVEHGGLLTDAKHRQDVGGRHFFSPHQHHRLSPRGYREGTMRATRAFFRKCNGSARPKRRHLRTHQGVGFAFRARHRLGARAFRL